MDKYNYIRKSGVQSKTTIKSSSGSGNIKNLRINNSFKIVDKIENIFDDGFLIEVDGPNKIGFGSYGYLKTNIENEDDFYKILFLKFSKAEEVELIDDSERMIIFKPNEKKEIIFRYKISDSLSSNYIYTFPFSIYNDYLRLDYNVSVEKKFPKLKLENLPVEKNYNTKSYSNNDLNFDCEFLISKPKNYLNCKIKNPNNFILNNVIICQDDLNCNYLNLNVNEEKLISFKTNKLNLSLNYYVKNQRKQINISFNSPQIVYDKKIVGNILNLNTLISNFDNNTKINVLVNDKIKEEINSNSKEFKLELFEKNNEIKFEIYYNKILINTVKFNQDVNEEFLPNFVSKKIENISYEIKQKKSKNIIDKILEFILNFLK